MKLVDVHEFIEDGFSGYLALQGIGKGYSKKMIIY
jgi:hypothetical protein